MRFPYQQQPHDCVHHYCQLGGSWPVYSGSRWQRGHGLGSFLGGLIQRRALPFLKRGAFKAGGYALRSGAHLLDDVGTGKSFKEAAKARVASAKLDALNTLKQQIGLGLNVRRKRRKARALGVSLHSHTRSRRRRTTKRPAAAKAGGRRSKNNKRKRTCKRRSTKRRRVDTDIFS